MRQLLTGVLQGVGAASAWAVIVWVWTRYRAVWIKATIRKRLSNVHAFVFTTVEEARDPLDRPQCGFTVCNDTKWDLVVRSAVLNRGDPNSKPSHSNALSYHGALKPEYADHILLKPGMRGEWVLPIHRLRYRPVINATVEVEYKSPLGTTSVLSVTTSPSSLEHLQRWFVMHYQHHNPLALPPALRSELASAIRHKPPGVADLVSAWKTALRSDSIRAQELRTRFRLSPTATAIDRNPELERWLDEEARRILNGKDAASISSVAELFSQKPILVWFEFNECLLELLSDPGPVKS